LVCEYVGVVASEQIKVDEMSDDEKHKKAIRGLLEKLTPEELEAMKWNDWSLVEQG